jgi:hypothetical protein
MPAEIKFFGFLKKLRVKSANSLALVRKGRPIAGFGC